LATLIEGQEGDQPREGWKPYEGDKPREGWKPYEVDKPRESDWRWCPICGEPFGLHRWMQGDWVCGNCFYLKRHKRNPQTFTPEVSPWTNFEQLTTCELQAIPATETSCFVIFVHNPATICRSTTYFEASLVPSSSFENNLIAFNNFITTGAYRFSHFLPHFLVYSIRI
jgi:hypothetical protein